MHVTNVLADLGFGDYEARAYVALLRRNPVNGYELAKLSDVPRGNIYAVLQRLEDRGAVVRVDTEDGTRYAPVSPEELLERMEGRFQHTLDTAAQLLKQVTSPIESAPVWNMEGYQVLLDHARSMIGRAQQHLLLAVWPDEAKALVGHLTAADERGVGIRTLCLAGCPQECGACRGRIHRYRLQPEQAPRWLVVIPDRVEVLAGEIGPGNGSAQEDETTTAIRTRQQLLVNLTASYIRHSIALAAILGDVGPQLYQLLPTETRDVLELISQEDQLQGWLAHVKHLGKTFDQGIVS